LSANDQEIELIVAVTGAFETSGDPYSAVAGDFDGMGISCGVLQWNLGSNSFQPIAREVGQAVVLRTMPVYGVELWSACNATPDLGCEIVRRWQTKAALSTRAATELKSLMDSPEMRRAQLLRIAAVAQRADDLAAGWARDRGQTQRTTQELIWFFDVLTQNGSMRGVGYKDVQAFVASSGESGATRVVCDWLESSPPTWWGREDCLRNAALWRGSLAASQLDLFVLSYLRASIASHQRARGIVMNRKGSIAIKRGYVNKSYFDFSDRF
jgi:hypothetical protein